MRKTFQLKGLNKNIDRQVDSIKNEVRKYIKNRKNSDLFTSKNDKFFSQELTIYDTK